MKVAITGKGGVGKTTFASTLCRLYADEGRKVLAADVDPDANLGLALGLTRGGGQRHCPRLQDEGAGQGAHRRQRQQHLLQAQPRGLRPARRPDARDVNGVKLLVMGTVDTGGSGCVCPEHVMLKAILSNLVFRKDDVVVMDMEAGLEHLGRGTASMMDQFIVVIEPGARVHPDLCSASSSWRQDIGVTKVRVVANKVRDSEDEDFIRSAGSRKRICWGSSTTTPEIIDADRHGKSPYDFSPAGGGGDPGHQSENGRRSIKFAESNVRSEKSDENIVRKSVRRQRRDVRPCAEGRGRGHWPSWAPTPLRTFGDTAYSLPCLYAMTGKKVATVGEAKAALETAVKAFMTRSNRTKDIFTSGVATALCRRDHRADEVGHARRLPLRGALSWATSPTPRSVSWACPWSPGTSPAWP